MAIIKMQKVKAGKPYGLKAVLDYIQNPDKTDNGHLISAKDCLQECAYRQMHLVKQDYKQSHGRQYVHIIQSFSLSDDLTFETAHEIGQKLLESFHGFQGVVATHTDRQHIHNHIVLNSVNFESGLKWQQSKRDLQNLKDLSDQLCNEYGLSVIEKGVGWQSYGENQANKGIGSWKQELANVVATSVKKSNTREEFIHYLNDKGIEVEFRKDDILFSLDNGKKCRSDTLMSYGDYSKENLNNHFQYNNLLFMEAENNPMTMYQAVGLASDLLGREDRSELGDKYLHGKQLSALEGEALKEAISELMKGGGYKGNNSQQNKNDQSRVRYFLMTIADTLESIVEDRNRTKQYELFREKYNEEEELEI